LPIANYQEGLTPGGNPNLPFANDALEGLHKRLKTVGN